MGVLRNLSRLEPECAEESEEIVALDIFSPLATLIATYSQERQLYKVLFFLAGFK